MKKIIPAVLLVSILANIALVVVLSRRETPDAALENPNHPSSPAEASAKGEAARPGGVVKTKVTSAVWAGLANNHFKQLTANLTAAGFPREAIRAAINGMLDERYRPRLDAIYAKMYDRPFWHRDAGLSNPEFNKELRAIETERLKITRELLGTNIPNEEGRRNRQGRYGQLSDGKLDAIEAIVTDYQDLSDVSGITFGAPFPWDRERRVMVEAETRKDIAALLTPEELAAYDLRASSTAINLRYRMETFKPTMAEFTAILPLQQAFDAKHADYAMNESPERVADKKQLEAQIKGVLGETRYAEFQRAQDNDYRTAYRLAERLSLPTENANAVYAMKQEYENRASAIRTDQNQSKEQRTAALKSMTGEAKGRLETLLTPSGAKVYSQSAFWLQTLERQISGSSNSTVGRIIVQ